MSCYEWERGTITLPSKDYSAFRKKIISTWNAYRLELFNAAKTALPKIKAACKGKVGWEAEDAMYRTAAGYGSEPSEIVQLVSEYKDGKRKLRSPKKKDIGLLPVSKQATIAFEDASIHFSDSNRTVTWSVEENNHACEDARSHPLGVALFKELRNVNWVRGTGGTIVGNDEYNKDSEYDGGGANYVTDSFGPAAARHNSSTRYRR